MKNEYAVLLGDCRGVSRFDHFDGKKDSCPGSFIAKPWGDTDAAGKDIGGYHRCLGLSLGPA